VNARDLPGPPPAAAAEPAPPRPAALSLGRALRRLGVLAGLCLVLWGADRLLSTGVNPYVYDIVIRIGITIVLAVSLNLINGFTGQFSLGHAGFMAVGGYAAGAFTYHIGPHWVAALPLPGPLPEILLFLTALLLGAVMAGLAGLVVGVPSLRLKGDYLAIATLGFGEIIRVMIINLDGLLAAGRPAAERADFMFIGGAKGLSGVPHYSNFFWVFLAAIGVVIMVRNLVRSSLGRAFVAVREDEVAAEAMGINTTAVKVLAFVIGSAWAGVAGGLHGHFIQGLYPNDFTFLQSIDVVVVVVLGGIGSITGSVVTAALLRVVENVLRSLTGAAVVFYLFVLIGAVLSYPRLARRRGLFAVQFGGYLLLLTLALVFASDWLSERIAFLRGALYALLLILLMLNRPQGLLGKSEIGLGPLQRWLARRRAGRAPS
jgi:branched-chain amino acid transport system permease protein